jgi:hypothetical protein
VSDFYAAVFRSFTRPQARPSSITFSFALFRRRSHLHVENVQPFIFLVHNAFTMLFQPATFAVVALLLTGQVISVPTPRPVKVSHIYIHIEDRQS